MDLSPSPELNEESMLEKDDGMFGESAAELVVESEVVFQYILWAVSQWKSLRGHSGLVPNVEQFVNRMKLAARGSIDSANPVQAGQWSRAEQ